VKYLRAKGIYVTSSQHIISQKLFEKAKIFILFPPEVGFRMRI
jgi:hypothetical protein